MAKLLLAFAGWVIGYDGSFEFENIGDNYVTNNVPYIGLRSLPALLGTVTCPIIYAIMRESGYPRIISLFSAALVVFGSFCTTCRDTESSRSLPDNAHIAQTRLILLDAPLLLFMSLAIYSYVRFHKLRYLYAQHASSFFNSDHSLQRVLARLVQMARLDRRLLGSHHQLQDERSFYLHDCRHSSRRRPVELVRLPARTFDGEAHPLAAARN